MKKLFFVSLILAVFTAVGFSQENVVGKKVPVLTPPEKVVVSKIEASSEEVRYEISLDASDTASFVRFTTDVQGSLTNIDVLIRDRWAAAMKKRAGNWVHNYEYQIAPENMVNINTTVWNKFFIEKVASTPVTVRKDYKPSFFTFEDPTHSLWEFVGINEDKGEKQVVVRKVGTTALRAILADNFLATPRLGKPFVLAKIGDRYCPVLTVDIDGKSTFVIDTQIEPSKKLSSLP